MNGGAGIGSGTHSTMAKVETFVCDMCGVEKKQANHWFRAWFYTATVDHGQGFAVTAWGGPFIPMFQYPSNAFGVNSSAMGTEKHICGEKCLHTILSAWIGKGSSKNA